MLDRGSGDTLWDLEPPVGARALKVHCMGDPHARARVDAEEDPTCLRWRSGLRLGHQLRPNRLGEQDLRHLRRQLDSAEHIEGRLTGQNAENVDDIIRVRPSAGQVVDRDLGEERCAREDRHRGRVVHRR